MKSSICQFWKNIGVDFSFSQIEKFLLAIDNIVDSQSPHIQKKISSSSNKQDWKESWTHLMQFNAFEVRHE